jgi:hypothetical protein
VPQNLAEQVVLDEAEANAGQMIFAPGQLGDAPRLEANYGSGEWAKFEWVHYCSGGTVCLNANGDVIRPDAGNYTVHYFMDLVTGERVEFKFTNKP